jgi:hypothetical protein
MNKINWEKVGNFTMNTIAIAVGSLIVYVGCKIAYGVISALYTVLIK